MYVDNYFYVEGTAMTKKPRFRKRYVLGVGRPSFYYANQMIGLVESGNRNYLIDIDVAPEFRYPVIPLYRLVLERVKP